MKALTLMFSFLLFAAAAPAQTARGLEVLGFNWKYEGYVPVETVRSGKTATSLSVKRGTDYVFKYRARATFRNSGAKEVKAVEWEFVFYEPEGERELKRYRLQSKQRIRPGETLELTRDVFIKPHEETRHINTGRRKVLVTRVEYADGSAWRPEDTKQ